MNFNKLHDCTFRFVMYATHTHIHTHCVYGVGMKWVQCWYGVGMEQVQCWYGVGMV